MKQNIFEKIETILKKSMITLGLILLLLTWGLIPIIISSILKINYQNMNAILKIIISFFNDLCLIFILIGIYHKTFFRDFKNYFETGNILENIFTSLKYWLLGLSIMVISNSIITIVTNGTLAANEEAVRNLIDTHPLYMAFQLIIYAPLTEELIFRKSIREITNNKVIYILLTGLIFGGMHVISSIQSAKDLLYLIPYCSLGFTFGYLYTKTDNIFSTITAHATHNTLALILYLMQVMS